MSKTCQQLIRELASRIDEFFVFTTTGDGSASTILVSSQLVPHLPQQTSQINAWINAIGGPNDGDEARISAFSPATYTATLHPPGLSNTPLTGETYELHAQVQRSRKLEALNAAIRLMGLYWSRPVIDTSITTAQGTWSYTLPAGVRWRSVSQVEIQVTTDNTLTGYPYMAATQWNWAIRRPIDASGNEVWTLQFEYLPPPGRNLRITGEAYYGELAADADILPSAGDWEGPLLEWLYDYAEYRLQSWLVNRLPTGDVTKFMQMRDKKLEEQRRIVVELMRPHGPGRVIVPGLGTGAFGNRRPDWRYLGALRSP